MTNIEARCAWWMKDGDSAVQRGSSTSAPTFTIARNGTVTNVQVSQPSGNYLLDTSAKRAVMDANPLPGLPSQFDRADATVELWFQLHQ